MIVVSCKDKKHNKSAVTSPSHPAERKKDYVGLVISFDSVPSTSIKKIVLKEDSLLSQMANHKANPYYYYFKARRFVYEKKIDSAIATYQLIKPRHNNEDLNFLKLVSLLNLKMSSGGMVEPNMMDTIFTALKASEQAKSRLSYHFYDLLARAYFQNGEDKKSLEYAAIYFKNHPFNHHLAIKQRYYDISFLLASRLEDFKKMSFYNNKARQLALIIHDSLAIARTYDNESQIYSKQLLTAKAVISSKIYFSYLKKSNNLNDVAYNNLGTAFSRNQQPDSAIKYYKEGIALEKQDVSGKRKNYHFNGLVEAYKMKGDFANALDAADSAYTIEIRNLKAIEAGKVAEMHEKYASEKKDVNIAELNARNKLNETIIKQQRWTIFLTLIIFIGVLSFFYIIYRQQRLREKNKLLKSENQRLNVEQKMLQAQLNPHFIFNSIANLQSLIASGANGESVLYLKAFSGLLRGILEQNRKDFIEVDEEIGSLNNYLQLQKMRYFDVFDYRITVSDDLDTCETLIPPMLLQPFVENAIEHGFRNISYKGLLVISFSVKGAFLMIEIDDNGIGLHKNNNENRSKQSLAQIILRERIELIYTANGQKAQFEVKNKVGAAQSGVLVAIQIPLTKD